VRLRGLALIGLAAVAWGTTGAVTSLLAEEARASPLLVGAARLWLGAAVLAVGAWLGARSLAVHREDRWPCVVMGLCMAAFQAAYFTAVTLAGIAVTALVAISSAPLLIATLAALTLGEPLTRRVGSALALGIAGTALLVFGPRASVDLSARFALGVALAFTAGLAYALYVVIAKASLERSSPLPLAAITFAVAAVLLTPALVWTESLGRQLALAWPWLVYLGVVATGAAYAAYTVGLRTVPASQAGIASLLEPLTATLLGVGLFGERLGAAGVVGAVLLIGALMLLATAGGEARPLGASPRRRH
jgi:DME family drug/metabolite transporter